MAAEISSEDLKAVLEGLDQVEEVACQFGALKSCSVEIELENVVISAVFINKEWMINFSHPLAPPTPIVPKDTRRRKP